MIQLVLLIVNFIISGYLPVTAGNDRDGKVAPPTVLSIGVNKKVSFLSYSQTDGWRLSISSSF